MEREGLLDQLFASRLARCVADALFRRRARRRLRALDSLQPARAQFHVLQRLVQQARGTRFGHDHDFARIRTEDDFRRLVPLRSAADLWQLYGDALTHGDAVTWPGPVHHLARSDSLSSPVIVTADLVQAHRTAFLTALALALHARPHGRFLSGTILLAGGGTALTPLRGAGPSSLEALMRSQLPAMLRACTDASHGSLDDLAARAASQPITCLAGNTARLVRLADLVRQQTGRGSLREAWPMLQAVLYSRGPADPPREQLLDLLGDKRILALETCARPEGAVAVEDPRHGFLRVVPDQGVYFEFVPVEDLGRTQPRRLGLGEVNAGTPYALAVTSAAGMWACLSGMIVCFERCDVPLLRSVEMGLPAALPSEILPLRTEKAPLAPPHHPQSGGSSAGPAKRLARNPWSARADQR